MVSNVQTRSKVIMELIFINPFSEEFLKEKEIDDNLKLQNSNDDNDVFIHLSYKRINNKN